MMVLRKVEIPNLAGVTLTEGYGGAAAGIRVSRIRGSAIVVGNARGRARYGISSKRSIANVGSGGVIKNSPHCCLARHVTSIVRPFRDAIHVTVTALARSGRCGRERADEEHHHHGHM
ncbi:hypothetical protein GOP47_0013031 [Adiantum capillus-veneris]|uniref:Uncharacterized protein n=1 Tax=Adiantum capillus-veneris TaxID=13818 RepID=A0A9D4ZH38_ADICA|nr:hypothetical protein GOP47_0013031 [Adiantum capillus-veneris]